MDTKSGSDPIKDRLSELPKDWEKKLQVGYGTPLNEEQFKALMKSRGQTAPVVLDLNSAGKVPPCKTESSGQPH